MTTTGLLDRAVAVLDGAVAVPAEQRVVAAAQLARSALELAVTETLLAQKQDLSRARMGSRLTVFAWLTGAGPGAVARLTWTGLSRACHRHAFELPSGEDEIRALMAGVRLLIQTSSDGQTAM